MDIEFFDPELESKYDSIKGDYNTKRPRMDEDSSDSFFEEKYRITSTTGSQASDIPGSVREIIENETGINDSTTRKSRQRRAPSNSSDDFLADSIGESIEREYCESDLIRELSDDPKFAVQCIQCGFCFKNKKTDTITKHYSKKHKYKFKVRRHRAKAQPEPEDNVSEAESNSNNVVPADNVPPNPLIAYCQSELVHEVLDDPHHAVQCFQCGMLFKSNKLTTIARHYTRRHNYNFQRIRQRGEKAKVPPPGSTTETLTQLKRQEETSKVFNDAKDYLDTCVKHQQENNLPMSYWDSESTRKLHGNWQEMFSVEVTAKRMEKHIAAIEEGAMAPLQQDLIAGKMFSLRFDVKSRKKCAFIILSAQFLCDFVPQIQRIGILTHRPSPTTRLFENIRQLLQRKEVREEQIHCATTDNGGCDDYRHIKDDLNFEKELIGGLEHSLKLKCKTAPSPAKLIQLTIEDGLSGYQDQLKALRKLWNSLSYTTDGWAFTYERVKDLLNNPGKQLSEPSLSFAQDLENCLRPFYELHKKAHCGYVLGDLVRDLLLCERQLNETAGSMSLCLLSALEYRKGQLFGHDQYMAAIYVDPRLNNRDNSLLRQDEQEKAVKFLLRTYEKMQAAKACGTMKKGNWMADLVPTRVGVARDRKWPNYGSDIRQRIEKIQNQCRPIDDIDVLQYWKGQSGLDAELSQLCSVILTIPASQIAKERELNGYYKWIFRQCSKDN